jgi:hypothetical protein
MPCSLHPALFDLWSSLPCNPLQPPVSSFLLGLNIFLGVVFQTPSNRVPSLRQSYRPTVTFSRAMSRLRYMIRSWISASCVIRSTWQFSVKVHCTVRS